MREVLTVGWPVMASSIAERWQQILDHLGRQAPSEYAYPDPRGRLSDLPLVDQERTDEREILAELWEKAAPGGGPAAGIALDAGCGLGPHSQELRTRFEYVLSIDGDSRRLRTATASLNECERHRFCTVSLTDQTLDHPVFRGAFRFIQCIQVIGHIPLEAQVELPQRLARLLEPGGLLILALPFTHLEADELSKSHLSLNRESPGEPIDHREYDQLARHPPPGVLPVRHFSLMSVRQLLEPTGLLPISMHDYGWKTATRGDLLILAEREDP